MTRRIVLAAAAALLASLAPAPAAQTVFTEDATLLPDDIGPNDRFGTSVAMSGDVVVAGMERPNDQAAGASFFRRVDGTWIEELFVSSTFSGACDFGWAVSVDGPLAVVSDPNEDSSGFCSGDGTLSLYSDLGGWTAAGELTGPSTPFPGSGPNVKQYGYSLAIRGTHMVAGTPGNAPSIGIFSFPAVIPHDWNGTGWSVGAPFTGSDTTSNDSFGESVALSEDGLTLAVGAPTAKTFGLNGAGAAYVFRRVGGIWVEERKFAANDASLGDQFGTSVAVNADGTAVAVGAMRDDSFFSDAGSVYLFRHDGRSWSLAQNFGSPTPAQNGAFGVSMAMSGTRLAVGARGEDRVHLYRDVGTSYVPLQSLQARVDTGADWLGIAVALDGGRCAAGARLADVAGDDSGAVYVYELPDLALTTNLDTVPPGGKATLVTSGGVPGMPCAHTFSVRGIAPGLAPVVWGPMQPGFGTFGPEGGHVLKIAGPPGLADVSVTVRAYGQYQPGLQGASNEVTVAFE